MTTGDLETGFDLRLNIKIGLHWFCGILVFALATTSSCSAKSPPTCDQDVNHLAKLIELPVLPAQVWFGKIARGLTSSAPGPTDWIFVAVMRFDPQALQKLSVTPNLDERKPATILKTEVAPWFPKELMPALTSFDEQHYKVKGRKFTATPFAAKPGTQSDHASVGSFFVIEGLPFVILRRAL